MTRKKTNFAKSQNFAKFAKCEKSQKEAQDPRPLQKLCLRFSKTKFLKNEPKKAQSPHFFDQISKINDF